MGYDINQLPEFPGTGSIPEGALFVARDPLTHKDKRVPASRLPSGARNANALRGGDKHVSYLRPYIGMPADATTRDGLDPKTLAPGTKCYVQNTASAANLAAGLSEPAATYVVEVDSAGPLTVMADAGTTTRTVKAKWVDAPEGGGGGIITLTGITESVGGFHPGDSFTGDPQAFASRMLVSYQNPYFNAFLIDGLSNQNVVVGTPFPDDTKVVSWSMANAGNVTPNSVDFRDVTAGTTLLSNTANDGSEDVPLAGFTAVQGESRRYRILSDNTQGGAFSADIVIAGYFESFFGYSSTKVLTMAQILALGNAQLQSGKARTVGGVTAAVGQYTVYAWPISGAGEDIGQVLQDGVDSIRGAFGAVAYVTGPNSLGAQVTMGYIVSNADGAFLNSTLAFN